MFYYHTMKNSKSAVQFLSWIFITTAVLLSSFSFAQSWNNSNFIDSTFRAGNPTSGQIVAALFGTVWNTGTAYTNHWVNNTCNPAAMQVVYVPTNDLNNTPNLAANTIYVLEGNQTLTQSINANNDCIAVVGSGNIIMDHNTALTPTNSFFRAISANAWLIIDGIESVGAQFVPEADHFLYTNLYNNITVNNIAAERFFGTNIVGWVLYFNVSDNIGIFNSYIHNNPRRWIQWDTTDNVHIKNNTIAENTYGIFLSSTTQTNIENNKIHDNNDDGVHITTTISTNINRNEIFNNWWYGIIIMSNSTNTNINTSKVYNNGSAGIRVSPSTNTIISNSIIHNNGWDGIYAAGNTMAWLVIDTVQAYNNQESAIEIINTSGTILHNLRLSTTNISHDTLKVTAWVWQMNRFYGSIQIYGQAANVPALVAGSANDPIVASIWRSNGVISSPTATTAQLTSPLLYLACEIGVFHIDILSVFGTRCQDIWSVVATITTSNPYHFGEKILKQTQIPYYINANTLGLTGLSNPQLYIADDMFGWWIQTTGWANYINSDLVHFTNTNTGRIYASQNAIYNIWGEDIDSSTDAFDPITLTGNILAWQQINRTLPRTGNDGMKLITMQLNTGATNSNKYQLFRYYDTTGPDQIILNSPTQGAQVLGNQVTLDRSAGIDTGAGLSGYNYVVASDSGFANVLFSGTTGALTANFTNMGMLPNYYRKVQGFDNLGNLGTATTGLFHYGFWYFDITPANPTFPTNSGQTFTITAYDINGNVITGYTNTVTFSLTGANTTPQTPPANYTFTLTDTGTHTFTGLLNINYPGIYTFDVMDTLTDTRLGSTTLTVIGQAPSMFSGTVTTSGNATSGIIDFTIDASNYPANYTITVNGAPWDNGSINNPTVVPVDLSSLPDGTYTITTVIDDGWLYTYTITTTIIVDTIDPIIIIQNPAIGSYQTLSQPMLDRSSTETWAGMSGYVVVMSGTSLVYTATNQTNNTYRIGTPLVDGPRTMTIYGYDNAGNFGTAATSFIVDNTPPVILSGSPHQVVVTNPVTFNWYVLETGWIDYSSFYLMDYYNNRLAQGQAQIAGPNTSVTVTDLWLGTLAPGVYRWTVAVVDYVNQWGDAINNNQWFIFAVHNAIPWQLQWFMEFQSMRWNVANIQGSLYTNTTQIQAALFANIASNVSINGNINPTVIGVPLLAPFPYTLQAINLTPGDGVKNLSAVFSSGTLNPYSVAKQITLDTTAPSVPTLTAPISGVAVTGAIILSRSGASDLWAGLSQYEIQVATGQTFANILRDDRVTHPTINTIIASGTLAPGQYYRRVLTTDRVGNISISEVESFTIAAPNTTVLLNGTGAIPNSFSIPAINNANPNILYRSSPVTIGGLANGQRAAVSISAGTLIKNGTSIGTTGTAVNGDILEIDLLASSNYDTQVNSTLNVGTRSAAFNLRTKTADQSYNGMTNTQRLQIRIIFDSLVNTYGINDSRTLTLMMTLRTAIESMLGFTNYSQSQKDALEYFLTLVNGYINERWWSNPFNGATYTARNGRVFSITFDSTRAAYTSPQFVKVAYFSSWTAMKLHIDIHNPGSGQGILSGNLGNIENANRGSNVHVMPNGKIYRIEQWTDSKRYSPDTISQKKFNTQAELLARLRANNPSIRHY